MNEPFGGLSYRVQQLERTIADQNVKLDEQKQMLTRLEALPDRVASLTKAAYWVAGIIVASSIGFAFSVLTLFQ